MAVKRIAPDRLVLILATHAHVSGELKPIGVGANAADRQRHLPSADQDQLAWDRSGDHRIRLLPGRAALSHWLRRRRGRGDRVEEAHAVRLALFPGDPPSIGGSRSGTAAKYSNAPVRHLVIPHRYALLYRQQSPNAEQCL
jgi:hypothetical protein